jgi:uncharacterized protein YbjT (DUF2867 family)
MSLVNYIGKSINTNNLKHTQTSFMKIVVIGGTGLIGTKVVSKLRQLGHEVVAATPSTGVNTITGEGLAEAFANTEVVVDVSNSPSFEDKAVMDFFQTAGENIIAAEKAAGVKLHVALSVVGTERLQDSGYFRAKLVQEQMINESGIPFTIVHATQFFEFLGAIAAGGVKGDAIHITPRIFQPIASDDVADAVVDATLSEPLNGIEEIGGPDKVSMAELVKLYLAKKQDTRTVIADDSVTYFGVAINDRSLVPDDDARLGEINFETWFKNQAVTA